MTSNAIRNKEILANVMMNSAKLKHDAAQREKDRVNATTNAQIGAVGRIGGNVAGALLKGFPNSPEWYKNWPLIADVIGKGTIPTYVANDILYPDQSFMPAVVTFYYEDTYGPILSVNDTEKPSSLLPINEAALRFQTNLYSYNSVLSSVQPSDVMQYTLGGGDCITLFSLVARACKAYKTFDVNTHKLNELLVDACGWDIDDMKLHYKDIVSWLITETESFNRDLSIPAGMTLLERKWFLAGGCWGEDYGKNSAIYVARPMHYHVWNETSGKLIAYPYPKRLTFQSVINMFTTMKNALVGSSDIVALSRNIKSGERNGLKLVQIPLFEESDLPIFPVDEVLEQFMNAVMPPRPTVSQATGTLSFPYSWTEDDFWNSLPDGYHLVQDSSGYLIPTMSVNGTKATEYTPYSASVRSGTTYVNFDLMPETLNFLHDEISVDDMLVGTRLTPLIHLGFEDGNVNVQMRSCGTEILLAACVKREYTPGVVELDYFRSVNSYGPNLSQIWYALRAMPAIIDLKSRVNTTNSTIEEYIYETTQDWHSMVSIDRRTLYSYHLAATLSEFYIPSVSESKPSDFKYARGSNKTGKGKVGHKTKEDPDKHNG